MDSTKEEILSWKEKAVNIVVPPIKGMMLFTTVVLVKINSIFAPAGRPVIITSLKSFLNDKFLSVSLNELFLLNKCKHKIKTPIVFEIIVANPIANIGLEKFTDNYTRTEDIKEADLKLLIKNFIHLYTHPFKIKR